MIRYQDKEKERIFFDRKGDLCSTAYEPVLTKITDRIIAEIRNRYSLKTGLRILEAGCGDGAYGQRLCQKGYRVIGVDISPKVLPHNINLQDYSAIAGDIEKGLFLNESFDAVVVVGFLHHFPDLLKTEVIGNFRKWLRKDGLVFVLEPNGYNLVNIVSKIFGKIYVRFKPDNIYLTPNERNHTLREYKYAFSREGFEFLSSCAVCEPGPNTYSGIMRLFVYIRNMLRKIDDMILPFPYKGWGCFMIFKK